MSYQKIRVNFYSGWSEKHQKLFDSLETEITNNFPEVKVHIAGSEDGDKLRFSLPIDEWQNRVDGRNFMVLQAGAKGFSLKLWTDHWSYGWLKKVEQPVIRLGGKFLKHKDISFTQHKVANLDITSFVELLRIARPFMRTSLS